MSDFDFSALKPKATELDKRSYSRAPKETDPTVKAFVQQSWDSEKALEVNVPEADLYAFTIHLRRAADELGMGISIQPTLKAAELKAMRDSGSKSKKVVKFQARERRQYTRKEKAAE